MADELIVGAECSHRKEGGIYFPFLIASTIDSVSRVGGLRRRLKMSAYTTHHSHRVPFSMPARKNGLLAALTIVTGISVKTLMVYVDFLCLGTLYPPHSRSPKGTIEVAFCLSFYIWSDSVGFDGFIIYRKSNHCRKE